MENTLKELLDKYLSEDTTQVDEAKRRRDELLAAYKGTIAQSAQVPNEEPSKAERYFKLAQAFLTPGQTGSFAESLGRVGQTMSEMEEQKRLARRTQQLDALKAQKDIQTLDLQAAQADVDLYSEMMKEEGKTRGEMTRKLIEQGMKPKEAQSPAGKQAMDEGLTPGTPNFHKRVAEIARASGDAAEARLNMAMANAALSQARFERAGTEMSSKEIDLLTNAENTINATIDSEALLTEALRLNPDTYDTSISDSLARMAAEGFKPDHPKVVNTRDLENILQQRALEQLKITFVGAISNEERRALMDLQGIESKSKTERQRIIQRALDLVVKRRAREEDRQRKIREGFYRYRPGAQ